jgi:hypothetical protein
MSAPLQHHLGNLQVLIEGNRYPEESWPYKNYWNTYDWFDNTIEDMRLSMRELLQHCNNAEVAEKAWKVLDMLEVGE